MKSILVTGTTFGITLPWYRAARRASDMVGRALAQAGFGLVTGSPPGVDAIVSASYCDERRRLDHDAENGYQQLWLPHFKRGYWLPGRGYVARRSSPERLGSFAEWMNRAISLADAAVMIGGRGGAFTVARRFMDAGKPVFPIPHSGGRSQDVFYEILKTWDAAPVPGLSRGQFLRLAIPWISDTGALKQLLLGTVADNADIFISYRRNDAALAAGRLHADIAEHFGARRVFMDLHDIAPSATWARSIDEAVKHCRLGILVIGPRWLEEDGTGRPRLMCADDMVRMEIAGLLASGKRILPLLVDGATLPPAAALPAELQSLPSFQAPSIDNASWEAVVRQMIRSIEQVLDIEMITSR